MYIFGLIAYSNSSSLIGRGRWYAAALLCIGMGNKGKESYRPSRNASVSPSRHITPRMGFHLRVKLEVKECVVGAILIKFEMCFHRRCRKRGAIGKYASTPVSHWPGGWGWSLGGWVVGFRVCAGGYAWILSDVPLVHCAFKASQMQILQCTPGTYILESYHTIYCKIKTQIPPPFRL